MRNSTSRRGLSGDRVDWEALARYLSGESPADEAAEIRKLLESRPADAEFLAALDRATQRLAYKSPADIDVEAALRRVTAARHRAPDAPPIPLRPRGASLPYGERRWSLGVVSAIAAALILVVGLVWWSTGGGPLERQVASSRTFITNVGERDSIALDDGSRVVLGPESRLVVPAGYGERHREVDLTGEAFFEARHDESRPFLVRAGAAAIRDLGTAFTVRSHLGDSVVVVVTSGSVALGRASGGGADEVVLREGDVGVLQRQGGALARRGGASDDDIAWTRGRLVFRDAPVSEVTAQLRRWYGIELSVPDASLANRHLTATFEGESVDKVLDALALALGARVERRGDSAVVRASPGGARAR